MSHPAPEIAFQPPPGFNFDLDSLRAFEQGLDPRSPEASRVPARVLGYGEISTVFAIQHKAFSGLAFKRLPIFYTAEEMARYLDIHEHYNRLVEEQVGIRIPPCGYAAFITGRGRPVFYIIQKQEPSHTIASRAIHRMGREGAVTLFTRLLGELRKVWDHNARQVDVQIAIDGQISNWAIQGFDPDHPKIDRRTTFRYLDTSTPLFRLAGREQLDPELFLRSAPSFLRWVLRLLFLQDVMNRYYDFRKVVIDVIANFYKEQKPEWIPDLVQAANEFFAGEGAAFGVKPVTEKEVRDYYEEDATIWRLYLAMRRLDRFLQTRLLRREYPYILPGQIKR